MTEEEMRDTKAPSPKSLQELSDYIDSLVGQTHDYGTCVYAMSLSAVAAFNYVAGTLGVTGFQASCADLDIIRRTRSIDGPFAIIVGNDMLYPQKDIPEKVNQHLQEWSGWAKEEAEKLLAEHDYENPLKTYTDDDGVEHEYRRVHPDVWAHWQMLASSDAEHPTAEGRE